MLTSSQKTQVQAQFHTCVSTRMRSWHMVAVTFLIFIEEMLNFPVEDEDFTQLCLHTQLNLLLNLTEFLTTACICT